MPSGKTALKIRKVHRYLGLFLGIQFLMWTISGLYFSWTDIDDIHGDQYKNLTPESVELSGLVSPTEISHRTPITQVEIREINNHPYYLINKKQLYNATTGAIKKALNKQEALSIAKRHMRADLEVASIEKISDTDKHHEYRNKLLPAYVISYESTNELKAYVSIQDATFQTVRHRSWRWFDFLWMTHTMDYEGRDNFNTTVLRVFSLLGLITVMSGFALWYVSSPSIRAIRRKRK